MTRTDSPYHFIAIGLGPFNLSLACLTAPLADHRALFLERRTQFDWHPGMLLPDATLQNPFLADLVSLADPTSRFSYLNYCKQRGTLFSYFIREKFYLTRREYNLYCRWAASQLPSVRFGHEVEAIEHDPRTGLYRVRGRQGPAGRPFEVSGRRLVIGIGSAPRLPACCGTGDGWVHTADYLDHKARLQATGSVTVIGSGQSSAEVFLDLLQESDRHGHALHWITRSPRFFAMDTSRLSIELLCPDYIDHFFGLPDAKRAPVAREHRSVYNGINARLVDAIHDRLHERHARGGFDGHLLANAELRACRFDPRRGRYVLDFVQTETSKRFRHATEAVVFGTGYAARVPAFIEPVRHRIRWDREGRYDQARNHSVDLDGSEIFVQNAGFQRHGFTSPDLGLACHRNAELIQALTGVAHYKMDHGTALQDFAPPASSPWFELDPDTEGAA